MVERRAGAVSMEETGFAQHARAQSRQGHARSFAHRASTCGMMQCGATGVACMRAGFRVALG
jgi:hypothetical protein